MASRSSVTLVVWALVLARVSAVGGQEKMGELHIEGRGIEQLVLRDNRGDQKTFSRPGATVTLPAGGYAVNSIRLERGHYSQAPMIPNDLWTTVDPNARATLKVGAPLRQVVKIERRGPVMVLNYGLVGRGGERYAIRRNQDSGTPAFSVYRGDEKVSSGQFEFG